MSTRAATGLLDRRRAVSAARHRRRRTALLVAVAAFATFLGGWWIATGPLLRVSNVSISGYRQADQAELVRIVQIAGREGTMLRLPTVNVREALVARFPWVADVSVHHNWPRGLDVKVVQAIPVAVAVTPEGARLLVSDAGRVLGPAPDASKFPSFRTPDVAIGAWLRGPLQRAPFEFLSAMSPGTAARVRDVRVVSGVVVGRIADGPELRVGAPRLMYAKGRALEAVLMDPKLAEPLTKAQILDLSSPKQPTLAGIPSDEASAEASTGGTPSGQYGDQVSGTN